MTLSRTLLHYAGVTAVLLAASRLASAIPGGKPRVVRIVRGPVASGNAGGRPLWFPNLWNRPDGSAAAVGWRIQAVTVYRFVAYGKALVRESYVERVDVDDGGPIDGCWVVSDPSDRAEVDLAFVNARTAYRAAIEPLWARAMARAVRGEDADAVEPAPMVQP